MDKPRICDVLGFNVGERFVYKDPNKEETTLYVEENGMVVFIFKDGQKLQDIGMDYVLVQAINHPDRIIHKPRWTQQEVEFARLFNAACKNVVWIQRNDEKTLVWVVEHSNEEYRLPFRLFPSIQPGQSYTLDEIIGGAE